MAITLYSNYYDPYLVYPFISNDSKWGGIEENVVVFVLLPEWETDVSQPVVGELVKVGSDPNHSSSGYVVGQTVP